MSRDRPTNPLVRTTKRLIAAAQVGAGMTYKLLLKELADEFQGLPAYLTGIRIKGACSMTAAMGVNTFQNHALIAQRAIDQIRLRVNNFEHLQLVDGEDLHIDEALRTGKARTSDMTFAALATGANTVPVDVMLRLDNPRQATERRHDETIALANFANDMESYLQFVVGTNLGTGTQLNVAAAGFAAGIEVTFYVVFRMDAVVHTPWQLRSLTARELEHRIETKGGVRYLLQTNRALNQLARVDHTLTDFRRLALDGEELNAQLTHADYYDRANFDRFSVADAPLVSAAHKQDVLTSTHGWQGTPVYLPPPDTRSSKLMRGTVGFLYGAMPVAFTDNQFRYLIRETGQDDAEHAVRVATALGADPSAVRQAGAFQVDATSGKGAPAAGILPKKLRVASKFGGVRR